MIHVRRRERVREIAARDGVARREDAGAEHGGARGVRDVEMEGGESRRVRVARAEPVAPADPAHEVRELPAVLVLLLRVADVEAVVRLLRHRGRGAERELARTDDARAAHVDEPAHEGAHRRRRAVPGQPRRGDAVADLEAVAARRGHVHVEARLGRGAHEVERHGVARDGARDRPGRRGRASAGSPARGAAARGRAGAAVRRRGRARDERRGGERERGEGTHAARIPPPPLRAHQPWAMARPTCSPRA